MILFTIKLMLINGVLSMEKDYVSEKDGLMANLVFFKKFWRTKVLFVGPLMLRFTSSVTPADCIKVSLVAEPFRSTYLQTCPKPLVEVWARAQTHERLCGKHSTVYYLAIPAQLPV